MLTCNSVLAYFIVFVFVRVLHYLIHFNLFKKNLTNDTSYHIKYMHIGDLKKEEIEKIVTSLHPPLRMRLRFLVHTLASSKTGIDNKQHSGGVTPTMLPSTSIATMISMSESMDTS